MSKIRDKNLKILKSLKVAFVVEELTQLGGAERLLDYFLEEFPKAPIYTLIWDRAKTLHKYDKFDIRPSFIQKLPFGVKRYKWYLALMPKAIESFDLSEYDIVISITSALCKGVKTKPNTLHICYCNTPTRYLWTDTDSYLKTAPIPKIIRPLIPAIIKYLRNWDLRAAQRPDFIISNSENVRKRILKYYKRKSDSIFVPVDCSKFKISKTPGKYYLIVSRLEPYKKVDLVIEAFKDNGLPLLVVGSGTKLEELRKHDFKNIKLIGRLSDDELARAYENAIAVIHPQEEDAGIVPLEAMSAGRPVIAFAKGGALETVVQGKTGVLFNNQTIDKLNIAINKFQKIKFNSKEIRKHAQKYDKALFKEKVFGYTISKYKIKFEARNTKF